MSKHHKTVIARNEAISQLCQSWTGMYFSKRLPTAIALLCCLTLSLNSIAQKKDTAENNISGYKWICVASIQNNAWPLILVDEIPYFGKISKLNNRIKNIEVIKGITPHALFGVEAANGLIAISTSRRSSKNSYKFSNDDTVYRNSKVYVVDGRILTNFIATPGAIIAKNILCLNKDADPKIHRPDSVIFITTMSFGILQYQHKLSLLSKAYSDHIAHAGDKDVNYILNGRVIQGSDIEKTRRLYDILAGIDTVSFVENQWYNGPPSQPYIAIITTKK